MFWSWSLLDTHNPYVYVDAAPRPFVFKDHSLVEVARFAQRTSYVGSDGNGYGIWFWVTPGSGIAVNIGKCLRFEDKNSAVEWSQNVAAGTELACASTGLKSCTVAKDTLFCAAARKQGYDSILSWRDRTYYGSPHVSGRRSDIVELILCPKEEPPELKTVCPDEVQYVQYSTGTGQKCTCNAKAEIATCLESGDDGRVPLADDYGTRFVAVVSVAGVVYGIPTVVGSAFAVLAGARLWRRRRGGAATTRRMGLKDDGKSTNERAVAGAGATEASIPLVAFSS